MTNEKFSDACHFSLHHTRSKITLNSNSMSYMQTYPLSLMQLLNFYLLYNFGEEQLKIRVQNERRVHVNHYLHTLHFLFTHTQKQIRKCTLDNNMIFEYYSPNFTIAKSVLQIRYVRNNMQFTNYSFSTINLTIVFLCDVDLK